MGTTKPRKVTMDAKELARKMISMMTEDYKQMVIDQGACDGWLDLFYDALEETYDFGNVCYDEMIKQLKDEKGVK